MDTNSRAELKARAIRDLLTPVEEFFRFEVFQGEKDSAGKVTKTKTVGMAYLKPNDHRYGIKLFTFVDDRFYLLPDKHDPSVYVILTSTPNRWAKSKLKFNWNVIGNGKADTTQGLIELTFDLLPSPIYLNLFPTRSATGTKLPDPIFFDEAA